MGFVHTHRLVPIEARDNPLTKKNIITFTWRVYGKAVAYFTVSYLLRRPPPATCKINTNRLVSELSEQTPTLRCAAEENLHNNDFSRACVCVCVCGDKKVAISVYKSDL